MPRTVKFIFPGTPVTIKYSPYFLIKTAPAIHILEPGLFLPGILFLFPFMYYIPIFCAKSAIASEILICCGQTASQLLQPMQALGSFSCGYAERAIGAMKPPSVKQCSLYRARSSGMGRPCGQWLVQ